MTNVDSGKIRMRHLYEILHILWLLSMPLLAQTDPNAVLHDALVLENRGSFETAAKAANVAIDSGQLNGAELGRAYIILGVACHGKGSLTEAQNAFEHSLRILERDRDHIEDYASALENYAGLYSDLGQLEMAALMWSKAFRLRWQIREHTGTTLSLIRLAELALAGKRVHEARKYLQRASDEAKLAPDLTDDDRAFFFETEGWLALAERHADAAVEAYRQALALTENSRGVEHWLTGWEHMLRGKAYAQSGDLNLAIADMQTGLAILDHALGRKSPKFFAAEIAYSQLLDRIGSHTQAAQMRAAAERARKDYYGKECAGCTISIAAFR